MTDREPDGYVRLSISMPRREADNVRAAVQNGAAPSVSAYILDAIQTVQARRAFVQRIATLNGGPFPPDAIAWAHQALGLPTDDQDQDAS